MKRKNAITLRLFQLMERYLTVDNGIKHIEKVKWGNESYCIRCGVLDSITLQNRASQYWRKGCRQYFVALTNVLLERPRVDIRKWLPVNYLLMVVRKEIKIDMANNTIYARLLP